MKKSLIIVSGVIVAGAVLLPGYVSSQFEQNLQNMLNALDANPAYTAKLVSIDNGFYSSKAVVEVGLDMQSMSGGEAFPEAPFSGTMKLDVVSSYGPILFGEHSGLGWVKSTATFSGESLREDIAWEQGKPLCQGSYKKNLFGSIEYTDQCEAFESHSDNSDVSFTFSGYEGEGSTSGGVFDYEGKASAFTFEQSQMAAELNSLAIDIKYDGDLTNMLNSDLVDSEMSMSLDFMSVADSSGLPGFSMEKFETFFASKVDKTKQQADMQVDYKMGSLEAGDVQMKDIDLQVEFNRLDTKLLTAMQKLNQQLDQSDPEKVLEQYQALMDEHLLGALKAAPEMKITKFTGEVADGKFDATANMQIVNVEQLPELINDPSFWFTHMQSNAKVVMDEAFVEYMAKSMLESQLAANPQTAELTPDQLQQIIAQQTPAMIAGFEQQGMFVKTDNGYETTFTMENGQAELNGVPIPLPVEQ